MTATTSLPTGTVQGAPDGSLRDTALRSGAYMTVRETLGALVRLAGLVVVMRQIGPAAFGVYSAAAAYVRFPISLAQMGAEVFAVRQPGVLARRTYDEIFTFLLVSSGVVVALGFGLSFLIAPWLRPFGVLGPLRVLLFAIPVNVLWAPYQACIERRFAYRRMGLLELSGDVALYAVAAPMALLGYGAWSLVAGFFAWQAWLLVGSIVLAGVRPHLAWSNQTARALLVHGRTYSMASWIVGVRSSIVTMIVAIFTGATGVGLMSFASRLVATMNFTDRGVHRVGMVAISKARTSEPGRMAAALEEGTMLLVVVSALPLVAFGLAARWVVPDVFGSDWLPGMSLYVLLALWAVVRVPMVVQRTLLYARGRNMAPAVACAVELVIASLVSLVAVRELGIVGYGIATLVAVSSAWCIHVSARRLVEVHYRGLVVPLVALLPAVCVPLAPMPWALLLLLPAALLVVHPTTRRELGGIVETARATLVRRRVGARLAGASGAGAEMAANEIPRGQGEPAPLRERSAPCVPDAVALLAETDPLTGLASPAVLLARLGHTLGVARDPGWSLGLVALDLSCDGGPTPLDAPPAVVYARVATSLRAELRFDDIVARVGPSTFVVMLLLVDGDDDGAALAAHLGAAVDVAVQVVAPSAPVCAPPAAAARTAWTARTAHRVVPLPSEEQADVLVRQMVEVVRG